MELESYKVEFLLFHFFLYSFLFFLHLLSPHYSYSPSQIHPKINQKLSLYLWLRIVKRNCRRSIRSRLASLFVVGLWVCKLKLKWICCFVVGLWICLGISLFFSGFAFAFVDLQICLGISFGFASTFVDLLGYFIISLWVCLYHLLISFKAQHLLILILH